ncbi:MAG: LamG domain-containing protein, partial [Phycisphaerales bacterium]
MFRRLIYLVSFALVPGVFLGVANADIETGLVGYWPLDEGAGTTTADASGNGHNGTFAEGTPVWVEGMFGKALQFDGSSAVEIPDHADFHLEDAVSMALWIKPEDNQPEYGKPFIKQKSGEYPYAIQYNQSGGSIRATVNASARFDTPGTPNFVGEWGHLCMTYDGSAVILYKDGEEVAR